MDERLVNIKRTREDRAQIVVREKNSAYEDAIKTHEESTQVLSRYQQFRINESERLFDEMHNQQVSLKQIETYGRRLGQMKIKESSLNQDKSTNLAKKNAAENERNLAKLDLREKQKAHEKFKELRKAHLESLKISQQKQDELTEEETNELFVQGKVAQKDI